MPVLSPDHFRFDTLPEDEATCPGCDALAKYECTCDVFADPDDKDFYND